MSAPVFLFGLPGSEFRFFSIATDADHRGHQTFDEIVRPGIPGRGRVIMGKQGTAFDAEFITDVDTIADAETILFTMAGLESVAVCRMVRRDIDYDTHGIRFVLNKITKQKIHKNANAAGGLNNGIVSLNFTANITPVPKF